MPARTLSGEVVSDRADKTVVVRVERRVMHPVQKKFIRRSKRYSAHDAENECRAGDTVVIRETAPISKTKRWIVVERRPGPASGAARSSAARRGAAAAPAAGEASP